MNKKGFTLIELIVVIAILGIIVLLAMPKLLGYNEKAINSAVKADLKTVQTAVDVKIVDNGGISPYDIEIGDAKELDVTTLKPEYLQSLEQRDGYEFWIDGWDNVYYNGIHPPENVKYENGTLSWDGVEDAEKYNIYILSDKKEVSLLEKIGIQTVFADSSALYSKKKLHKTTEELSMELSEGTYLVSAVKGKEESVAVGANFKGGIIEGEEQIEEDLFSYDNWIKKNEDGTYSLSSDDWVYSGSQKNNRIFSGDELYFDTVSTTYSGLYKKSLPDSNSMTMDIQVKSLESTYDGGINTLAGFRLGNYGTSLVFYPGKLVVYDGNIDFKELPIFTFELPDTSEYHSYRIVQEGSKSTIYVDKIKVAELNLKFEPYLNEIAFGDGTGTYGTAKAYYKDLKYTMEALHY